MSRVASLGWLPGWPAPIRPTSQYKVRFDESYEPVVVGQRLFVGINKELTVELRSVPSSPLVPLLCDIVIVRENTPMPALDL